MESAFGPAASVPGRRSTAEVRTDPKCAPSVTSRRNGVVMPRGPSSLRDGLSDGRSDADPATVVRVPDLPTWGRDRSPMGDSLKILAQSVRRLSRSVVAPTAYRRYRLPATGTDVDRSRGVRRLYAVAGRRVVIDGCSIDVLTVLTAGDLGFPATVLTDEPLHRLGGGTSGLHTSRWRRGIERSSVSMHSGSKRPGLRI